VRQLLGTNLCAYYACENLRAEVTEGIDFQTVSEQYTERIVGIQEEIAGFLLDHVINPKGEFHISFD
jgi:hypothetical protein